MKKQHYILIMVSVITSIIIMSFTNVSRLSFVSDTIYATLRSVIKDTPLPKPPNFKVAYFAFDASTNVKKRSTLSLTNFANEANVVVLFEGTAWEIADSLHYSKSPSYMLDENINYHSYTSIIRDVRILQNRGVKVLMNVDDAYSWNTPFPFTTYDGKQLNAQQFSKFIKTCVIDSLHLDGIVLDLEHLRDTAVNSDFISIIEELGKYFGPLSSNKNTTIYTATIYDGANVGYQVGQSIKVAKYFNFVMDMGYFEDDIYRFNLWAKYIGASKTMIGLTTRYNPLPKSVIAAEWEPQEGTKAGIMVFGANADSSYANTILRAVK